MKKAPTKANTTKKRAGAAPPKTGKRSENKERTKERILKVALAFFRKQGLEKTTTRQISDKAGIAEGTLFNYFKTKEDLALYFFQKETQDLIEWYEGDARLQKAPLPEKLFAIVHRQLEYIAPYEEFIGAVFFRSLQPSSKLSPISFESQELRLRYLRFIREILDEAAERGEIPPIGALGSCGFGLFYMGIVTHWLHDSSPGKQKTLALLDRSLTIGSRVLSKKGGWEW
jgi:AcrR family transcriptional regulator